MFNAYREPLSFELLFPGAGSRPWRRWLDTFLEAPNDICAFTAAPSLEGFSYLVKPRSIVALARVAEDTADTASSQTARK
jgi:isoamylase